VEDTSLNQDLEPVASNNTSAYSFQIKRKRNNKTSLSMTMQAKDILKGSTTVQENKFNAHKF